MACYIMKKYMLTFFGGNMALRYDNLDKAEKEAQEKDGSAPDLRVAQHAAEQA